MFKSKPIQRKVKVMDVNFNADRIIYALGFVLDPYAENHCDAELKEASRASASKRSGPRKIPFS